MDPVKYSTIFCLGLGMAVVLVSTMITLYYGTPITWALYLLVQPLESTNPCNGTGRNQG